MKSLPVLTVLALLGVGTASAQSPGAFAVVTDRGLYSTSDTIAVRFSNGRSSRVSIATEDCLSFGGGYLPRYELERLDRGRWSRQEVVYSCIILSPEPVELEPGASHTVRFLVAPDHRLPTGTYRYVYDVRDPEAPLPLRERTSNVFFLARRVYGR